MLYNIGDKVFLHISITAPIIFDTDFDNSSYAKFDKKSFEVVGRFAGNNSNSYIILVPLDVENSFELTKAAIFKYSIDEKYLGKYGYIIKEKSIGGKEYFDFYKNSLRCLICDEPSPFAEPNQKNDEFICWVCRNDERNKTIYNLE